MLTVRHKCVLCYKCLMRAITTLAFGLHLNCNFFFFSKRFILVLVTECKARIMHPEWYPATSITAHLVAMFRVSSSPNDMFMGGGKNPETGFIIFSIFDCCFVLFLLVACDYSSQTSLALASECFRIPHMH